METRGEQNIKKSQADNFDKMEMKQYSRDYARKWILETLAKQLSVKGQEPDKRKFKIGIEERNSRQQLITALGVSVGMKSRREENGS